MRELVALAAAPARGGYRVIVRGDELVIQMNSADLQSGSAATVAFRYYLRELFPEVTDPDTVITGMGIVLGDDADAVPKEPDKIYEIKLPYSLHENVLFWIYEHRGLRPRALGPTGDGLREKTGGGGAAASAPKSTAPEGTQTPSRPSPGDVLRADATIETAGQLLDRLRVEFPHEQGLKHARVWPELLAWVAEHARDLGGKKPAMLSNAELARIVEAFKKHVELQPRGNIDGAFEGGHDDGKRDGVKGGERRGDPRMRKAGGEGGSIYGEEGGGRRGWIHWEPKGQIELTPQQDRYVANASIRVELAWDLSVHPEAGQIFERGHCEYEWDLYHDGEVVDTPGIFMSGRNVRLEIGNKPGTYAIGVAAFSPHFLPHRAFAARKVINVISEEQASREAFDAAHTRGEDAAFERNDKGQLQLRPGEQAPTVDEQLFKLLLEAGRITKLAELGRISATDRDVIIKQLERQREGLEKIQARTKSGTPYVVRGTFTSREDSVSTPLQLLMHSLQRDGVAGLARHAVLLHDRTFGDPVQHPGSAERVTPTPQFHAPAVERDALADMAEHFHKYNDYPRGTIRLAAQQLTADTVWETTLDTNSTRKQAKKVLNHVALVASAAMMVVPGGNVVSVGLMTVSALASIASVTLEIQDRIAKEGELKLDRRLVLDVLQVVSTALPFGTLTRTLANASAVAKTRFLLCMATLDTAQGFLLAAEVHHQLQLIDASIAVALANAATEDERIAIRAQRNRQVAELLGGAMISGAFIVFSLGTGIKQIAATSHAGRVFNVREPLAKLDHQQAKDALAHDSFVNGKEHVQLTAEERAYLEHQVASRTAEPPVREPETPGTAEANTPHANDRLSELRAALPPEVRDVPIHTSGVAGNGVHVTYKDGDIRIEVGPTAEPRHVRYHVDAAKQLLKFQGPLGFVRRLINKLLTKLGLTPGYGTAGFEARIEVQKLRAIHADLRARQTRLGERAKAAERGEHADFDREIAEIQEQLEQYQGLVDSYEPGRGFIAAEGKGRGLPEYPIKKSTVEGVENGTDPRQFEVVYTGHTVDGRKVDFGSAMQELTPLGAPVGDPHLSLGNYVANHGVDHVASIYDDVVPTTQPGKAPEGKGNRTPITTFVLEDFAKAYERRFKRPLKAWKGTLAFENKRNFWREYVRLLDLGIPEPQARIVAVENISFGKHRVALGFTDFEVKFPKGHVEVDLGGSIGKRSLPPEIEVRAVKP